MARRPTEPTAQPLAVQAPHTDCACSLPWPQLDHVGLDAEAQATWAHQQQLARAARPPPVLPLALALLSLVGAALVFSSRPGASRGGVQTTAVAPSQVGARPGVAGARTPVMVKQ